MPEPLTTQELRDAFKSAGYASEVERAFLLGDVGYVHLKTAAAKEKLLKNQKPFLARKESKKETAPEKEMPKLEKLSISDKEIKTEEPLKPEKEIKSEKVVNLEKSPKPEKGLKPNKEPKTPKSEKPAKSDKGVKSKEPKPESQRYHTNLPNHKVVLLTPLPARTFSSHIRKALKESDIACSFVTVKNENGYAEIRNDSYAKAVEKGSIVLHGTKVRVTRIILKKGDCIRDSCFLCSPRMRGYRGNMDL
jgi:hypothetical protein